MVKRITGSYQVKYHPKGKDEEGSEEVTIDFTPPFKRIRMMDELEKRLKVKFPDPSTLGTDGNFLNFFSF